ncbi:MAG: YeeE/YedE thiosulfate transporter family protein [Anaerolineales bacterium]
MIASIATLILGFVIGYLGQRSRLCFVSGYRDFMLTHDTTLLKGVLGAFIGALGGFILFSLLGSSILGFPMILQTSMLTRSALIITIVAGLGVGVVGALSGGCPYRMHVLAAEGKKTYWVYLLGFYAGLIFYNVATVHFMNMIKTVLK